MTGATGPIPPAAAWSQVRLERELRRQYEAARDTRVRLERLTARARELEMDGADDATAGWQAGETLRSAGKLLDTWDAQLRTAGEMLDARRGSRGSQDAARILLGDAVVLAPAQVPASEQRPPMAHSSAPHSSLRQVAEFADRALRRAESRLGAVADVRDAVRRLRTLLAVPCADGVPAGPGGDREAATRLCAQAWADPLRIGADRLGTTESVLARRTYEHLAIAISRLDAEEAYARSRPASGGPADPGAVLPAAGALLDRLDALQRRHDVEGRADPAGIAGLADHIAAARRRAREPRVRCCSRSDCPGGTLDEDGLCTTCQREPRHREGR